ncbi:MAG: hypothetical protein AAFR79_07515 [Pseudomonadota bacterium]
MTDLPEQLRAMAGPHVGALPVALHQAADEIDRLRMALVHYGDRARMSNAPADMQQTIDAAFSATQR